MTKWYVIDEAPMEGEKAIGEYESEDDFFHWLFQNREWAKDAGDLVPSKATLVKAFRDNANHDVEINGFIWLKLTDATLEQWGYDGIEADDVKFIEKERRD